MTPLAYFLTFVTDTQAQEAAREILTFLLLSGAVWLYFLAMQWTGERLALRAEEERRMSDLEWYVAVAQYLELRERNAQKGRPTAEQPEEPFMNDNEADYSFQLRRSIEIAKERNHGGGEAA